MMHFHTPLFVSKHGVYLLCHLSVVTHSVLVPSLQLVQYSGNRCLSISVIRLLMLSMTSFRLPESVLCAHVNRS